MGSEIGKTAGALYVLYNAVETYSMLGYLAPRPYTALQVRVRCEYSGMGTAFGR